jgi:flagellar protein FlbT
MQEEQAVTPTSRVYFIVQLMLLNPDEADTYRPTFEQLMTPLLRTFRSPPILKALTDCAYWVGAHDYYKALAALRPVLDYEAKLLSRPEIAMALPDGGLAQGVS